ncbi:MAG: hypothetical protein RSB09_02860 [Clostridia bacterium]
MKKKFTAILATMFILSLPLTLFACNNDKPKYSLLDIYQNGSSYSELTGYKKELTLPSGWSVALSDKNSDLGYVPSLDAFIITNKSDSTAGGALSILKCGQDKPMFKEDSAINAIRVKGNLIATKSADGTATVYNSNGTVVLSRTKIGGCYDLAIDKVVKILDDNLIAVDGKYEMTPQKDKNGVYLREEGVVASVASGVSGYTSIFRPTTTGDVYSRGELVARVRNEEQESTNNPNPLAKVDGFDGKFVSVTGNKPKNASKNIDRMFFIPAHGSDNVGTLEATPNGKVTANDISSYYSEITYIGAGRFLVHEDWVVSETDDYTYYDLTEYRKVIRNVYMPEFDALIPFESNTIFLNLTNEYYGTSRASIDTKSFLNSGFMYASFGLVILENRVAVYDQFILDGELNVALSLSGNFGVDLKNQKVNEISVFDLIMDFVDGVGYMPVMPSTMRMYRENGELIYTNTDFKIKSVGLNDGIAIGEAIDKEDKDVTTFGAFDMSGRAVIPFKYTKLDPFRGYYTIGERENEEGKSQNFLIGKDGQEVDKLSDGNKALYDIATTDGSSGGDRPKAEIHKMGCYMFRVGEGATAKYGIKNLNANATKNIIMPATMGPGCTLYSPSATPQNVFVFEKVAGSTAATTTYIIYRLL